MVAEKDRLLPLEVLTPSTKTSQTYLKAFIVLTVLLMAGTSFVCIRIVTQMYKLKQEVDENRKEISSLLQQIPGGDTETNSLNNVSYEHLRLKRNFGDDTLFVGAHVTGSGRSVTTRQDDFFRWSCDNGALCATSFVDVVTNASPGSFLKIKKKGYYFVYSQIAYNGMGMQPIGHETVRKSTGHNDVLMQSAVMQRLGDARQGPANRMRNTDTSYHGGVFLLKFHDEIGVRPANSRIANQRFDMDPIRSFFGVFFIGE